MTTVKDEDFGFDRIKKQLKGLNGVVDKIGLFGNGDSPKNNIAYRGVVNEFPSPKGKNTNPERPFMRDSWDNNLRELDDFIARSLGDVILGKFSNTKMVNVVGERVITNMKNEINEGVFAPLKLSTIIGKGSSKPLIDSAEMLNSITHKITKGRK